VINFRFNKFQIWNLELIVLDSIPIFWSFGTYALIQNSIRELFSFFFLLHLLKNNNQPATRPFTPFFLCSFYTMCTYSLILYGWMELHLLKLIRIIIDFLAHHITFLLSNLLSQIMSPSNLSRNKWMSVLFEFKTCQGSVIQHGVMVVNEIWKIQESRREYMDPNKSNPNKFIEF